MFVKNLAQQNISNREAVKVYPAIKDNNIFFDTFSIVVIIFIYLFLQTFDHFVVFSLFHLFIIACLLSSSQQTRFICQERLRVNLITCPISKYYLTYSSFCPHLFHKVILKNIRVLDLQSTLRKQKTQCYIYSL